MRSRSFLQSLSILSLVSLLVLPSWWLTAAAPPPPIARDLAPVQPAHGAPGPSTLQPHDAVAVLPLHPSDDATVQEGAPSATDPSSLYLAAGYNLSSFFPDWADGRVRSYVRFDLAGLPAGSTIVSATLRLFQAGGVDYVGYTSSVTFYRVTGNWNEASITWNNRPGYAENLGDVATPHDFAGWLSLDLTAQTAAWAAGSQANYGLVAIGPEDTPGICRIFGSSESDHSPELRVRYRPAPPPVLDAFPGTLSARVSKTQPPPASLLQISNVTNGSVDWTATKVGSAPWLALSKSSGSATPTSPDSLTLTVDVSSLAPGNYTEQIRVSSATPEVEGSPVTVTFALEVVDQLTTIYLPHVVRGTGGTVGAPDIAVMIVAIADYQYAADSLVTAMVPDDWGGGNLAAPGFDGDDFHALATEIGASQDSTLRLGNTESTLAVGTSTSWHPGAQAVQAYPLATRANVIAAFGQLDGIEDEDTTVIFYFSGHGGQTPDDDGDESDGYDEFIAMYDTNTGPSGFVDVLTDDDLEALLANLESRHILVILDSCLSGSMMSMTLQGSADPIQRGLANPFPPRVSAVESDQAALAELVGPGRLIITAGTGDQGTWESTALENGVFTYFFLEALQESLNDANQNGRVSAEEAYWFSKDVVDEWVVANVTPTAQVPDPHQNPDVDDQYWGQMDLTWVP